jgi:histidyl-tRNA synthetase
MRARSIVRLLPSGSCLARAAGLRYHRHRHRRSEMTSKRTANTLKARLPRGFADRGASDIAATERMLAEIKAVYALYGFEALETPFIEYTEALGKFLPDQDRPNAGVFSFQDDDDAWLSLRYDLTAPLARHVAEHFDALPKPYRSYRVGWVFRNEKPGPGRFRQFMQFDADIVGAPSIAADAEMAMMMADTLEAVGIKPDDYVIKVNNRKVLDGLMEAIGLAGEENAARRLIVLRALDKRDQIGLDGVRALLGKERKDSSGDVTKGAGLASEQIESLITFLEYSKIYEDIKQTNPEVVDKTLELNKINPRSSDRRPVENRRAQTLFESLKEIFVKSEFGISATAELKELWLSVQSQGYDDGRIVIDPSVVRGLEYYTGTVFEAELTFEIADEDGRPVRFGAVAGGGRYDGLIGRFRGESVPATGFSIGVSRLLAALKHQGLVKADAAAGPVVVLVLDQDQIPRYQAMAARLRAEGIRAEIYLGGAGLKAQMKYADRRGAPCVVIQGSNERDAGTLLIKDLIEGARAAKAIAGHDEWKAARPGEISVPEDRLVETVRALLTRHGLSAGS